MGCANSAGAGREEADVQPKALARPLEHGGGGIIEISAKEYPEQELKLPPGCSEDAVPPMLAQYLTALAWKEICVEMKEKQWHRTNGDNLGPPIAAGLTSSYAPLTFRYSTEPYEVTVEGGRDEQGNQQYHTETRYEFKLSIDTQCVARVAVPEGVSPGQNIQFTHPVTQQQLQVTAPLDGARMMEVAAPSAPPAKPMTARSMIVRVPDGSPLGAEIEVEHPETKVKYRVRPPVPMAPGSQFRTRF